MPSRALSPRWIETRQEYWQQLDTLTAAGARSGVSSLTHRELQQLALLYRQTAADLATARGDRDAEPLARHLNQILARAHTLVYAATPPERHPILRFYTHTFPLMFRQTWPYTAAAFLVFALVAIASAAAAVRDPGLQRLVLGPAMLETIERHEMWTHSIVALKPIASSAITTNNLAVALTACGLGIFAGLGTVYLLALNGMLMGIITVACYEHALSLSLWSFVAPHGALELPAIFMSGGAGLVLAQGVLVPGRSTRRDALEAAGGRAIRLLLGVIPLLLVAGAIEGFVSPTDLPNAWKFTLSGALLALLGAYLLLPGRESKTQEPRQPALLPAPHRPAAGSLTDGWHS